MKRKLLKQILNEWQSNLWLAIELLIVGVVIWYLADGIYVRLAKRAEPLGFDTEHCYLIGCDILSEKSPDFVAGKSWKEDNKDLAGLLERLRLRPEIEAVALGNNSYPYNGSNSGTVMKVDTFTTIGYPIRRWVTPDFVRVFRYRGSNGETPEQLAEILTRESNVFLASENLFDHYGKGKVKEFVGRKFYDGNISDSLRLAATLDIVRYDDFDEREFTTSVVMPIPVDYYNYGVNELVVRVKDNMDDNFAEKLMDDAWSKFHVGNFYLSSVKSFKDIRRQFHRGDYNDMRNSIIGAAFLMLNIFLGLLGTFWFRTQQRVGEIAIRKVNGATRSDIFCRLIGEGELLLLVTIPFALAIEYLLTRFELNSFYQRVYFEPTRFFTCALISWSLMAIMIVAGIVIPAYRAMKVQPAVALMDE